MGTGLSDGGTNDEPTLPSDARTKIDWGQHEDSLGRSGERKRAILGIDAGIARGAVFLHGHLQKVSYSFNYNSSSSKLTHYPQISLTNNKRARSQIPFS